MAILVASVTLFSTSMGGFAAVRIRDRLHLLLGFSAGAVLGVAFFDVFPELVQRTSVHDTLPATPMVLVAGGFLGFFLLERFTALHGSHEHEHQPASTTSPTRSGSFTCASRPLNRTAGAADRVRGRCRPCSRQ